MPPNIPAPLSQRRRHELRECAERARAARKAFEDAREQEKAGGRAPHNGKALADEYASARGALSFALAPDVVLALLEDGDRLDDLSRPGALSRVFVHALENKAEPKTEIVAQVQIPLGAHTSCSSSGKTLREAIDNASARRRARR